ncbi:TonB-dependent receptor plug domain-containing protein [Pseudobythopirellula maris]|nr:TonB-dependent receptor [Pseudobythopirellula maris]
MPYAEGGEDAAGEPLEDDAADAEADDLDALLDMDLGELSSVKVSTPTFTDPMVEGISKTSEKVSESPGIVDVITAEEIEAFGAKNLYEVLERATSVYMTGTYIQRRNVASIRGNLVKPEDNHVLTLINGRPFRDIVNGGFSHTLYTAFPLHAIERVEVMRGPGSVLYGTNAVTGVINIVTKQPDKPTAKASTLGGSDGWQSYGLTTGDGSEDRSLLVSGGYFRQEGWPFTATLEDAVETTTPFGEDNVGVFGSYRDGGFTANCYVAELSQTVFSIPFAPEAYFDATRVFADFGYLHEIDENQNLQLNFTYNYTGYESETPSDSLNPFSARSTLTIPSHAYLAEATYRAQLTDDLKFLVGGFTDIHEGDLRSTNSTPVPHFTEVWYGAYLQLEYQPTDWLKLIGGMQGNMPGDIPAGIVPRAGAIVTLSDTLTAKLLYGQAFRSPYRFERYLNGAPVIVGNQDLEPEVIQTFDAQLAYATDNYRLAATVFHSDFFDVISRVGFFPQTYANSDRIEYSGLELENDWQLSDTLRWTSSLTYQENERAGVENTTTVPNWMAKFGMSYNNKCSGLNVGLFDTFFGNQTVPAGAAAVNGNPDAYHMVSLNTTLDLDRYLALRSGRSIRLQLLVQNLFDEDIFHVEFDRKQINTIPARAGRTVYGGVTVDY